MKKTLVHLSCSLFLALFLFSSCSKEGPAGPEGDPGPAGPQGPAGSAGAPGAAGPAGTANVIYSAWLDVIFEDITESGDASATWAARITATNLTNNLLSTGLVKVYVNIGTAASPVVVEASALGLTPVLVPQAIELIGGGALGGEDPYSTYTPSGGQKSYLYRYVLIPGGVAANASVNWNNYEETKKALSLKE